MILKITTENSVFYDDQDLMKFKRVPGPNADALPSDNEWIDYTEMFYSELTETVQFTWLDPEGYPHLRVTPRVVEMVAAE